jgi:enamine deaminase RidA (YjgF/YER057c/UK114 family)
MVSLIDVILEVSMRKVSKVSVLAATIAMSVALSAAENDAVVKHIQTPAAAIAAAVWVGNTLYVSGQTASPVTPADQAAGTAAVYGDTKTQSMSVFSKIEARLKEQGLAMGDVVMMHVFLVGDPAMGNKLDFAGMNAAYAQFFGTKDQPNKPARSTVQVASLASQTALVEIEVIAARSK